MSAMSCRYSPFLFLFLSTLPLQWVHAEGEVKKPQVPPGLAFVRTFDAQAYVERMNDHGMGAQSLRLRARYLDPDVNAFVGFVTGLHHFNQDLRIGDPLAPETAGILWNWGIDLGLKRGKSLWELDLMGSVLSAAVGPAVAIEGEHALSRRWGWYHRAELNFYLADGDTVVDADQGLYWQGERWGVTGGYRIFAATHMSRNGPRIGVRWVFESPKIPFIFPSLG
jgi:hypothetical protein